MLLGVKDILEDHPYLSMGSLVGRFDKIRKDAYLIIFYDSMDMASEKYTEMKINTIEEFNKKCENKINVKRVDFSGLLDITTMGDVMRSITELLQSVVIETREDPQYIIQIPTCQERYRIFKACHIESAIQEEILSVRAYNLDRNLSTNSISTSRLDVDKMDDIVFDNIIHNIDGNMSDLSNTEFPATPKGIIAIINSVVNSEFRRFSKPNSLESLKIAVVGCNSKTTGKYLSKFLPMCKATVTLYHSKSIIDESEFQDYDIVISCVGIPGFIDKKKIGVSKFKRMFVDVGVSRDENGKVKGDFSEDIRDDLNNIVTPYVNGVGLLTRLAILHNIILTSELMSTL